MKTLILLLFATSAFGAAISGGTVTVTDVSHSGARVCYDNAVAINTLVIKWDNTAYDPLTNGFRNTSAARTGLNHITFCFPISGLKAATGYTVFAYATRTGGDATVSTDSFNVATFTTSAAVTHQCRRCKKPC